MKRLRDKLGVCQWFHYQAYEDVERAVHELRALGIRHLRTGISWADFHRPEGREWYDWQMKQLRDFDVLLSIWHTPPSIGEEPRCAAPPRRLRDYADFIELVIERYGDCFESVELWNEPNNLYKWDFRSYDPWWEKFGAMVREASEVARGAGVPTVLGGMIPVDHNWLNLMKRYRALDYVDVVAVHGFPGMWWSDAPNWDWYERWRGWEPRIDYIAEHAEGRPIWVTETGLATWDLRAARRDHHRAQVDRLREAAAAPCERLYWYSLIDLAPSREAIEGFHVDENEYHLGLVEYRGQRKPAWEEMKALLDGSED